MDVVLGVGHPQMQPIEELFELDPAVTYKEVAEHAYVLMHIVADGRQQEVADKAIQPIINASAREALRVAREGMAALAEGEIETGLQRLIIDVSGIFMRTTVLAAVLPVATKISPFATMQFISGRIM